MSQWELLNLDRHEITVGIEAEVLKATDVFSVYNCDKKLYLNTSERGKISIYNTRGEVVLIDNVYEGETSIDVSILEKGIYIIQLQTVSGINHVKSKIN